MTWRPWWTPAVFSLLALAWLWPAPFTADLLGRRADALGTVWFVSAAGRLLPSLHDPLTGWPLGADYTRPDSWTLLFAGVIGSFLTATRLVGLVAVFGVIASAWAAEAFSRSLGAKAPWSLIAGLAYAFSGLAATAWIEGYPYHLADPWLPLCGLAWMRAVGREGTPRDGLLAAGAFALALATSAWHGLAAAVLVVGLLAGARAAGVASLRPVAAAGAAVGLLAVVYAAAFFSHATGDAVPPTGMGGLSTVSERLLLHTAPAPSVDIDGRSQTAWFSSVMLGCFLVSPVVARRDWRVRALFITAVVALFLALIPLPWDSMAEFVPVSRAGALASLRAAFGRFPERLGWTWVLAGGVIAGRVATELHDRAGRAAWPLLLLALVEVYAGPRLPWRQLRSPGGAPSAYNAASGPVFDLWPTDLAPEPGWDLRVTNTNCFYQASHGRPTGELCLLSPGVESPRAVLTAAITSALLDGEAEVVRAQLASFGYSTIALHPDVFRPSDRARILSALAAVDPAPAESVDMGDHVVAFAVSGAADAETARAAWLSYVGDAP
ncbi:hypothetical protein LBMAG42_15960 [Deltaproteobacteria bacterium]|nr:hypothetical protein LBMAG42_15960 [Deltaproteobacteria bacterium]